jgi:hypothetical protein
MVIGFDRLIGGQKTDDFADVRIFQGDDLEYVIDGTIGMGHRTHRCGL